MFANVDENGKHASGIEEKHLLNENLDEALMLWMRELGTPPQYNKFQSAYFYAKRRLGDGNYKPTEFATNSGEERANVAKYMKAYYVDLVGRSQEALTGDEPVPTDAENVPEGALTEQIVSFQGLGLTPDQGEKELPDEKFARVVGGERLWDDFACNETEPSEHREERVHGF